MGRIRKKKHSVHRTIAAVRAGGRRAQESLFLLQINSRPEEIFEKFPKVVRGTNDLALLHGDPFPAKYSEMFKASAVGRPVNAVHAAVWAICRSCLYGPQLRDYLKTRREFESSIVRGKYDLASSLLIDHQQRMGVSLWLAQAWMTLGESAPAELRKTFQEEVDATSPTSAPGFLLRHLARRTESGGPKNFLKEEISVQLEDVSESFRVYAERGSTPLTRTLQLSPMMGQEECHAAEKALQRGVQA